ncbi:hypothetical protein [Sulfuracidifex metallicus]|uniref:hypothetical protein n=1 Tax=Sulfuracidifex metallicus TaxID=47303 RepID=UPI002274D353|nr:hypothetical protein [Sulfuracidifex metallicus]MCY0850970.1 hypothetical protein [Sulfuracidifex metallicus]
MLDNSYNSKQITSGAEVRLNEEDTRRREHAKYMEKEDRVKVKSKKEEDVIRKERRDLN